MFLDVLIFRIAVTTGSNSKFKNAFFLYLATRPTNRHDDSTDRPTRLVPVINDTIILLIVIVTSNDYKRIVVNHRYKMKRH